MSMQKGPRALTADRMKKAARFAGKRGRPMAEIAEHLDVGPSTARKVVDHAIAAGLMVMDGEKGNRFTKYKAK